MMYHNKLLVVWGFAIVLASAGCGGASNARYSPQATDARKALSTALETWKSGTQHGPITGTRPAINVFDARWPAGKQLESFEILETVAGQENPQFKVRMKLRNEAEETVTYHVVGIDPLNVFRDSDYKRASGI